MAHTALQKDHQRTPRRQTFASISVPNFNWRAVLFLLAKPGEPGTVRATSGAPRQNILIQCMECIGGGGHEPLAGGRILRVGLAVEASAVDHPDLDAIKAGIA